MASLVSRVTYRVSSGRDLIDSARPQKPPRAGAPPPPLPPPPRACVATKEGERPSGRRTPKWEAAARAAGDHPSGLREGVQGLVLRRHMCGAVMPFIADDDIRGLALPLGGAVMPGIPRRAIRCAAPAAGAGARPRRHGRDPPPHGAHTYLRVRARAHLHRHDRPIASWCPSPACTALHPLHPLQGMEGVGEGVPLTAREGASRSAPRCP